jgi:DNA primase catalytic core
MASQQPGENQPADLAAEARAWLAWNTVVYARNQRTGAVADLAARTSPDRAAAVLARVQTNQALRTESLAPQHGQLTAIHAAATAFFQSQLRGSWVPAYLGTRGMQAVFLPTSPWKIGYAPPKTWTALTRHLRDQGFSADLVLASGLAVTGRDGSLRDRFHDRLMIPIQSPGGTVIAFIGRRHPGAPDDYGPKYLNSPDSDLYIKGNVLAGLAEGRRQLDLGAQPVIVEGPLDAIAVSISAPGRFVGVTPCGTALTGEHVAALARVVDLPERGVRVALDPDPAGRKGAARAYQRLRVVTSAMTAVVFPDRQDPAELLEKRGRDHLRTVLTSSTIPLADLVVDVRIEEWAGGKELTFIEQQLGAIRAAAEVIAALPKGEVGAQAIRLAKRFDWDMQAVTDTVIQAIEKRYQAPARLSQTDRSPPGRRDQYAELPLATAQLARRACTSSPSVVTPCRTPDPMASQQRSRSASAGPQRDAGGRGLNRAYVSLHRPPPRRARSRYH